jgi:integrase
MESKTFSDSQKAKKHGEITTIFSRLIAAGVHTGNIPTRNIGAPRVVTGHRKISLTFDEAAKVLKALESLPGENTRRLELMLFFRLCVETGQRPNDLYLFDPAKIEADEIHYAFYSTKTRREQRVMHLLSPGMRELLSRLIIARRSAYYHDSKGSRFWMLSLHTISKVLNDEIKKAVGNEKILYATRHFFITEIFRRTDSTFWAEAFTHEGRTVAQCHYLHPDQSKADEILREFSEDFQRALDVL